MSILEKNQKFELYYTSSFTKVKAVLVELADFSSKYKFSENNTPPSFWGRIEEINSIDYSAESKEPDLLMEMNILSLFSGGEAEKFIRSFKTILANLSFGDFTSEEISISGLSKADSVNILSSDEFTEVLTILECSERTRLELLSNYEKKSDVEKKELSISLSELKGVFLDLKYQIDLISSFLFLNKEKTYFSVKEVKDIITSEEGKYEADRLALSFREYMYYDEKSEITTILYDHLRLKDIQSKVDYVWEDAFFMSIFLHFIFQTFDSQNDLRQEFWLKYYFVKAIVVGVLVRDILKNAIYDDTGNLVEFADFYIFIHDSLNENEESIEFFNSSDNIYKLPEILNKYMARTGDEFNNGYNREEYINDLINDSKQKSLLKKVLREVLYIYSHVKTLDLSEKNRGSEVNEGKVFDTQIERLLVWWLDEDLWDLIRFYFVEKKDQVVVPLSYFLNQIKENEKIEDEVVTEKILKFTDFLQENKILSGEDSLLEYHEEDDKFHWNEEILT